MAIIDALADGPMPNPQDTIWALAEGFAILARHTRYTTVDTQELHRVSSDLLQQAERLERYKAAEQLHDTVAFLADR